MNTHSRRAIIRISSFALLLTLLAVPIALAAPSEDRILSADQYTSDKARRLATAHAAALQELNAQLYHCLPWLEVRRGGIGFFKPKHLSGDERYLSLNVIIDQRPSAEFSAFSREDRASRMFSRYVGPLLRRMAADRSLLNDSTLDGFTVILSWLKAEPKNSDQPVNETIAVFIRRSLAQDYIAGRTAIGHLADTARVLAWDGETALGPLRLTAWDDNFVGTYKVANYEVAKGFTCR